jgi:hypothetical protein
VSTKRKVLKKRKPVDKVSRENLFEPQVTRWQYGLLKIAVNQDRILVSKDQAESILKQIATLLGYETEGT